MKKITNLQELINEMSFNVSRLLSVCWPAQNNYLLVNYTHNSFFERCYNCNNGVIIFVYDYITYVTPYTRKTMDIINKTYFKKTDMYVPFSNGDYPVDEKARWDAILERARKQLDCELEEKFCNFSNKIGVKSIDSKLLKKCFKIPTSGLAIEFKNSHTHIFPEISNSYDAFSIEKLGHYYTNKGVCVFVYCNGKTYVTPDCTIVDVLKDAGYELFPMYVPFSNGEKIVDTKYAKQWEKIKAKAS